MVINEVNKMSWNQIRMLNGKTIELIIAEGLKEIKDFEAKEEAKEEAEMMLNQKSNYDY